MKWNVFSLEAVKEALKPKFVLEKVRYVTDDEEYGEGESTRLVFRNVEEKLFQGGDFVNNISAVAIGMLIAAHREGYEEKFKAYVELIAETYEQQGNDHAANIIRSYYTGDYGEQGKVVLDETTEQTTYYETGWYEPDVLGSGGSYRGVTKATSEEEALQRLLKHSADYAHRITVYKKDGKTIKREISEYDQWEKKWRT